MPEHQVDAGFEGVQTAFIHQIEAEPAEAVPGLELAETSQQLPDPNIAEGRCVAVPVVKAEVCHTTGKEAGQILVGKSCRCLERRKHIESCPAYGVLNWGEIGDILDRTGPEFPPHPLVFKLDLTARWMRRPVDVNAMEVVQTYFDSAVAPMQGCGQVEPQSRHGGLVDDALGASPKLEKPFFSRCQVTGQELALGATKREGEG